MSKQAYKPEITVVRQQMTNPDMWCVEDDRYPNQERAYLVCGLPMPGERVRHILDGAADEVVGLTPVVSFVARRSANVATITPYDPEAEKVERVAKALFNVAYDNRGWLELPEKDRCDFRHRARAAIAAMEDE